MNIISGRNVHQILPNALALLKERGVQRPSRNGDVLVLDGVSVIEYERPCERVLFWPERSANPFFHLHECLWLLAGRNDVKSVTHFVKRMADFSDDGETFNSAYGYRWRQEFGFDQLDVIVKNLSVNHYCRRQVLSMWCPRDLAEQDSKDLPCNLNAVFQIDNNGRLNMTVFNRSNDLIMGALGANAARTSS